MMLDIILVYYDRESKDYVTVYEYTAKEMYCFRNDTYMYLLAPYRLVIN